ncbi:MAG: IS5 family transposase [Pirellulales bacterium]|nr:IS5 family transposase [Pirellulales bacterium]
MATVDASRPNAGKKATYQITNWREYNEALVRRGDVTFWFSQNTLDEWEHDNAEKKNGRPFKYSDRAIECLLALRELFRLPYRQTEGLGRALATLLGAQITIPDFTSLAKRAARMGVSIDVSQTRGPLDVVVDSTGLKIYGEGEWKVRQHGVGKRRTWRKLHLAIDPDTHEIVAEVLTENNVHDADQVEPLLQQIDRPVRTFYGDGAYDQRKVYDVLGTRGVDTIIPPRKNAKIAQHGNSSADPLPRDECIRQIRRDGRKAWKKSIGYHRRSLAETAMHRFKCSFGDRLKNRVAPNQRAETSLRCKLLNHFSHLGMPRFTWS